MEKDRLPTLQGGSDAVDRAVSIAKGAAAAVPFAGSLLAELISATIPNQRMDRLEAYLKSLAIALDGMLPPGWVPGSGATALLEESVYEAARPVSDKRREQIARLVAGGMTATEAEAEHHRFLLSVLKELSDYDLALLDTYTRPTDHVGAWRLRGLEGVSAAEQVRIRQLATVADVKLERLGLTTFRQRMDRSSDEPRPVYSSLGKPEGSHAITELGQHLLLIVEGAPLPKPEEPATLDF